MKARPWPSNLDYRFACGAARRAVPNHYQLNVKRTGIVLKPNNSRVVIRPFEPASESRIERILGRVAALSEAEVDVLLEDVMREFRDRHQRTRQFFLHRFDQVQQSPADRSTI